MWRHRTPAPHHLQRELVLAALGRLQTGFVGRVLSGGHGRRRGRVLAQRLALDRRVRGAVCDRAGRQSGGSRSQLSRTRPQKPEAEATVLLGSDGLVLDLE